MASEAASLFYYVCLFKLLLNHCMMPYALIYKKEHAKYVIAIHILK